MALTGWVMMHREILEWEWYDDANTMRLFLHVLLKANFDQKEWRGIQINRGQLVTSVKNLAAELQLSNQQTRTSLKRLQSTNEVTIKTTSKYSIITVTCYDKYQSANKQNNNQTTNEQRAEQQTNNNQTTNEQQTNNNNVRIKELKNSINKKEKGKSKRFTRPSLEQLEGYFSQKIPFDPHKASGLANKFFNHYESNGWKVGRNAMKSWERTADNWVARENENFKKGQTIRDTTLEQELSDTSWANGELSHTPRPTRDIPLTEKLADQSWAQDV